MRRKSKKRNIFADKATLILRKMLSAPQDKKWVVRNFTGPLGVSLGMAQGILETMEELGYVERIRKGPDSYTVITNSEKLIGDWLKEYHFDLNEVDTYYTADRNILKKIRDFFEERQYALTLHSAANLITSYVKTEDIYFYIDIEIWDRGIMDLRHRLQLKELTNGGNIHIVRPYYKNSVFFNSQKIKGYCTVSNLQLYLDLYNFQPRGREHAEYLKKILKEKGRRLE